MRVLGIDSSLTGCGLCLLDEDLKTERKSENKISTTTLKNNLKGVERILYIEREVEKWAKGCDLVVLEGYAFDRKFKGELLAELVGVIKRRLYLMGIPVIVVPTQKVKKILTGRGAKPKEFAELDTKKWTIQETYKNYGIDFKDRDNECDAFGLAKIGLAINRKEEELKPFEKLVVDEINNPKVKIRKTLKYYDGLSFKVEYEDTENGVILYCPGLDFSVTGESREDAFEKFNKLKGARIREMKKNNIKIKTTKKFINEVTS